MVRISAVQRNFQSVSRRERIERAARERDEGGGSLLHPPLRELGGRSKLGGGCTNPHVANGRSSSPACAELHPPPSLPGSNVCVRANPHVAPPPPPLPPPPPYPYMCTGSAGPFICSSPRASPRAPDAFVLHPRVSSGHDCVKTGQSRRRWRQARRFPRPPVRLDVRKQTERPDPQLRADLTS
jgi:hypothetical protein